MVLLLFQRLCKKVIFSGKKTRSHHATSLELRKKNRKSPKFPQNSGALNGLPVPSNKKQTTLAETPKKHNDHQTPEPRAPFNWKDDCWSSDPTKEKTGWKPEKPLPTQTRTNRWKNIKTEFAFGIEFSQLPSQKASIFWPPSHVPIFQPQCETKICLKI